MKRVEKCVYVCERERDSHTILSVKEGKRQTGPKNSPMLAVFSVGEECQCRWGV